jgi:hypothetical protein
MGVTVGVITGGGSEWSFFQAVSEAVKSRITTEALVHKFLIHGFFLIKNLK